MSELTVSLYGFARGQSSPAYYGYYSPDFAEWVNTNSALPHGMLIRCMTNEMLDGLPSELRDERWNRATRMPGWRFSHTLEVTDWPELKVVHDDLVGFVRELKHADGTELRALGSLSLVRQWLTAGLVGHRKLVVCPLVLP